MDKSSTCCFTGYRPEKFSFSVTAHNKKFCSFDDKLLNKVCDLAENGINTFICGMAMGFDILAAETVLTVKKLRPELKISLVCAVPFIEQSKNFLPCWKERYDAVLSECDRAVLLSDTYFRGCFTARNRFMVDNSSVCLTYFDGKSGGTKNTLEYAKEKGLFIINLAKI